MTTPFIIYGMPRSRTNWLSHFLTYRDWVCYHEAAGHLRRVEEIADLFAMNEGRFGAAETAAAQGWWLVHHYVPGIKAVVVRRPVEEVKRSLAAAGVRQGLLYDAPALHKGMTYAARCLDRVAAQPGVLAVEFADLAKEETCRAVFEHCLPYAFDREHWLAWKDRNMQAEIRPAVSNYYENKEAIDAFKLACRADLRRLAREGAI